MKFTKDDLKSLAHGACFLGSGGGGSLVGALNVVNSFADFLPVSCVSIAEALQNTHLLAAVVFFVGSPDSAQDLPKYIDDVVMAFKDMDDEALQKYDRHITYIVPGEIGAVNTIVPFVVAQAICQKTGRQIMIIDGDGAGRALPELALTVYAANGISCNPSFLSKSATPPYNICFEVDKADAVQRLLGPVLGNNIFNNFGGFATWLMDKELLEQAKPVSGTVSLAYQYGRVLRGVTPVGASDDLAMLGTPVFTGTLLDIAEHSEGGFDYGVATFEDVDKNHFYIYNQNENIVSWNDRLSAPPITAPDLICYLAEEFQTPTGSPEPMRVFSNTRQDWCAFQGKKVSVLGRPCDPALREGLLGLGFAQLRRELGYAGYYQPFGKE